MYRVYIIRCEFNFFDVFLIEYLVFVVFFLSLLRDSNVIEVRKGFLVKGLCVVLDVVLVKC